MLIDPVIDISFDSPRYITTADSIASGNGYRAISEIDNNPVFYNNYIFPYILAPLIRIFGLNPYPLKILILIFSLLSILLFFSLTLKLFSKKEALLLSISLMSMPIFIRFSNKVLTEAPFMLFLLLSLWLLHRYFQKDKKIYLGLLLVTTYFLIFTRTIGSLMLIPLFIYSCTKRDRSLFMMTAILAIITILTMHVIQSRTAPENYLYHIKYLLYKDAFTPEQGYIDIGCLIIRAVNNIKFYFLNIPKETFNLPSFGISLYAALFWTLLCLGMYNIRPNFYKTIFFVFFTTYISFFIIWPWQNTRFIYPILFIMLIYLYCGFKSLIIGTPSAIKRIIYLTVIISILYSGLKELLLEITVNRIHPAEVNELVQLSSWIKDNLPQEPVILSKNTALIYMLSSKKGTYTPYSYDMEKITAHIEKKGVTHILADRFNSEMIKYIYPWINKNKERLKIIKINGGTVLFELD
ncbi:MAG: glycosyltransferase family 39 protein [Candidatus Kaelpia aquatica]|nr:glycosyltransferase family 39 protein [Candidatus Kaelpia aquatica]